MQPLDRQLARHLWLDRAIRRVGIDHCGNNVVVVRLFQNWAGVGRLRWLDRLSLGGATLIDADLVAAQDLADLRYLDRSSTEVTAAGLD